MEEDQTGLVERPYPGTGDALEAVHLHRSVYGWPAVDDAWHAYPTFLERYWHYGPTERAWITAISMAGALIGGIFFGMLSDRWGRRRMIIVAMCVAIGVIPLWAFSSSKVGLILGAVAMQFLIQGAMGIVPAHLSEISPNSVRGFLVGFGYQCGVLISSSVVYVEAILAVHISYAWAMAGTALISLLLAIIGTATGPERHGAAFKSYA